MSAVARHDGADYYRFKAQGEDCAGFRKMGPQRSHGYAWIMGGVTGAPAGTPLTDDRIAAFIDGAQVR